MKLRIPYRPNRALTLGGRLRPETVDLVTTVSHKDENHVTRLASAPGWMVLLVRYDRKGKR